ncbi:hypothetical protein G8770_16415 [Aestuariicella hydrocarbonica]|uniref:Uncharacterized protein n=1 Tax=Pseudomaricurvus hydrocarbonicus TaxID=1470433 RepID=A0A9E5MMT8_9GAMM|nr:hypothetical protein [Aestuariicella hydrocarbonica]NHO67133.1 hypothetical protein [Aestuariicella hydrocarbonica]
MNFEDWTVDLKSLTATHSCGFRIEIEGNPKDPSAVHPGKFPQGLTSIEQVRLVRTGVEAIVAEAKKGRTAKPVVKKPAYVSPANKPKRATLSLNRKSSTETS